MRGQPGREVPCCRSCPFCSPRRLRRPSRPLADAVLDIAAPSRPHDRSWRRQLLRRASTRSPTFARADRRLQASDVIVYIELVPRLPGALEGRMLMLPRAHDYRYVRIQVALSRIAGRNDRASSATSCGTRWKSRRRADVRTGSASRCTSGSGSRARALHCTTRPPRVRQGASRSAQVETGKWSWRRS